MNAVSFGKVHYRSKASHTLQVAISHFSRPLYTLALVSAEHVCIPNGRREVSRCLTPLVAAYLLGNNRIGNVVIQLPDLFLLWHLLSWEESYTSSKSARLAAINLNQRLRSWSNKYTRLAQKPSHRLQVPAFYQLHRSGRLIIIMRGCRSAPIYRKCLLKQWILM